MEDPTKELKSDATGEGTGVSVVAGTREGVLMVPEQSVVLRPAGKVVYVVREGKAEQRIVETGFRQEGLQEIAKGLAGGETIAVDGAGFLTDGAAVALARAREAGGKGAARKDAGKG